MRTVGCKFSWNTLICPPKNFTGHRGNSVHRLRKHFLLSYEGKTYKLKTLRRSSKEVSCQISSGNAKSNCRGPRHVLRGRIGRACPGTDAAVSGGCGSKYDHFLPLIRHSRVRSLSLSLSVAPSWNIRVQKIVGPKIRPQFITFTCGFRDITPYLIVF